MVQPDTDERRISEGNMLASTFTAVYCAGDAIPSACHTHRKANELGLKPYKPSLKDS
jgi:hypothetical protein